MVVTPAHSRDRVTYMDACLKDLAGQWFDQEVEGLDHMIHHWTFENLICVLFIQFIHKASA